MKKVQRRRSGLHRGLRCARSVLGVRRYSSNWKSLNLRQAAVSWQRHAASYVRSTACHSSVVESRCGAPRRVDLVVRGMLLCREVGVGNDKPGEIREDYNICGLNHIRKVRTSCSCEPRRLDRLAEQGDAVRGNVARLNSRRTAL
jgi:hypothetical protein